MPHRQAEIWFSYEVTLHSDIIDISDIRELPVGTVTIRNLDDEVIKEIGVQAAENGVSREEEFRRIIMRAARARKSDIWERLARHREETRGTQQTDSGEIQRQMRDSR